MSLLKFYLFPILELFERNQDRPEIESQSQSNCEEDHPLLRVSKEILILLTYIRQLEVPSKAGTPS